MTDQAETQLDATDIDKVWRSTLTGALFRWNEGWASWERYQDIGGKSLWRPVKPGIPVNVVFARPGEEFVPVAEEDVPA